MTDGIGDWISLGILALIFVLAGMYFDRQKRRLQKALDDAERENPRYTAEELCAIMDSLPPSAVAQLASKRFCHTQPGPDHIIGIEVIPDGTVEGLVPCTIAFYFGKYAKDGAALTKIAMSEAGYNDPRMMEVDDHEHT